MKALSAACLLLLSIPALADDQSDVRRAVAEGRLRPLAEIIEQVQARHPGRIMDVELERGRDGTYVYEIEILGPDRRRFEVKIDGATGQPLEQDRSARSFHPLPDLLRSVLASYPGHVIDAEFEHGLYQIELVQSDGAHVQLAVDPRDGRVMRDAARDTQLARMLPMPEVLDALLMHYPGTVLEGELERGADGGYYYEFDVEDVHGRNLTLHVDAFSGEVLREEEG